MCNNLHLCKRLIYFVHSLKKVSILLQTLNIHNYITIFQLAGLESSDGLCCQLTFVCRHAEPNTLSMARDVWEIDRRDLTLQKKLGAGMFGEVWKGQSHATCLHSFFNVFLRVCKLLFIFRWLLACLLFLWFCFLLITILQGRRMDFVVDLCMRAQCLKSLKHCLSLVMYGK